MEVEKTIAFLVEHQASFAVRMEQIAERLDQVTERVDRLAEEGTKTRVDLRRAIRLGVQEARAERARRRELDGRLSDNMDELRAAQLKTEQMLQAFIQSMQRPTNGKP